ncbi:MAG: nuclear transport factor 2 family protein [Proteobacteria bacterium]|nr:nuclear transport factor 2 family protein [Pseudomonadota bacterium]
MDDQAYDKLMQANIARVFNERDAVRRQAAIAELYAADATLFEPGTQAAGHAAIDAAVGGLLASLPPEAVFTATGPAVGHHGLGRLRWQSGPVTGTDVAHIDGGRIRTLHVFIDPMS